jgi:hypothetical protein
MLKNKYVGRYFRLNFQHGNVNSGAYLCLKIIFIIQMMMNNDNFKMPINDRYLLIFLQFDRDGYLILDDFFSPAEVAEMLKAGRALPMQAPKEERCAFQNQV